MAVTRLKAARLNRGWTPAQAVAILRLHAVADQLRIATVPSLLTMLSRWEHGYPAPGPVYRRLLCQIYDATPDELGLKPLSRATMRYAQ